MPYSKALIRDGGGSCRSSPQKKQSVIVTSITSSSPSNNRTDRQTENVVFNGAGLLTRNLLPVCGLSAKSTRCQVLSKSYYLKNLIHNTEELFHRGRPHTPRSHVHARTHTPAHKCFSCALACLVSQGDCQCFLFNVSETSFTL